MHYTYTQSIIVAGDFGGLLGPSDGSALPELTHAALTLAPVAIRFHFVLTVK